MEQDDFFKPQSPEEEALFAGDRPPTDPEKPSVETPAANPEKKDEKPEEKPEENKESKDVAGSSPDSETKPINDGSAKPNKLKNEPDWRYNLRMKIWEGGKEALKAKTPEEKADARNKVEDARRELQKKSRENPYKPSKEDEEVFNEYKDPEILDGDAKRVSALGKKVGFASKDDVREEVSQVLQEEREKGVQNQALNDFFEEFPEIYGDEKNRNAFFDTVEQYFNYSGKDYDELRFMFDSAHKALYPEALEDTIAKSEVLKNTMMASEFGGSSAAEIKPQDQEKDRVIKDHAAKTGEDASWFLKD